MTVEVEEEISETVIEDLIGNSLVVLNDDHNSFEHVQHCFIKYLEMTPEEAMRCANLIDKKGKHTVKYGTKEELLPYYTALSEEGLTIEIQ